MIRQAHKEDIPDLEAIASGSHRDSRFFYDPCFPDDRCEAMYAIWIRKSVEGEAHKVFVPEINGKPSGYITCELDSERNARCCGMIGLLGVAESVRGKGVGSRLVQHALSDFKKQKIDSVKVITQGRNISAQRLYQKHGFRTSLIELTYHKWFL